MTLSALQTINTGTVLLESDGANSVLNVTALTSFKETNGWSYSTLQASNSGKVEDSNLASLSNVNLSVAGTGESLILGGLTSFNSGNITVSGGASLNLPAMTSYTGNSATTTLEATGTGSALTLANLASVSEGSNTYQAQTQFEALAGGSVTLSALQTVDTGTVVLESDGANSVLNVAGLTSFNESDELILLDVASLEVRQGRRRQSDQFVKHKPDRHRQRRGQSPGSGRSDVVQ